MRFVLKAKATPDKIVALYDELSNKENEFFYELVLNCRLVDIKVLREDLSLATMTGNCVNDIYSLLETDSFFEKKQKCLFDEEIDFELYTFGDGFFQYCLYQDGLVTKTSGELNEDVEPLFHFEQPETDIIEWIEKHLEK